MSDGYSSDSIPIQEERKSPILRQQTLSSKLKKSIIFTDTLTNAAGSRVTPPDPDRKSQEPGSIGKEEFAKISISKISKKSRSISSQPKSNNEPNHENNLLRKILLDSNKEVRARGRSKTSKIQERGARRTSTTSAAKIPIIAIGIDDENLLGEEFSPTRESPAQKTGKRMTALGLIDSVKHTAYGEGDKSQTMLSNKKTTPDSK